MFLPYLTWTIRLLLKSFVTTLAVVGAAVLWAVFTLPEPLIIDPVDVAQAQEGVTGALLAIWLLMFGLHVVFGPGVVSITVRHQEAVNHASAK